MTLAQLNESILLDDIKNIMNEDFRETVDADLDRSDIEYKSDFLYEPKSVEAYTFLGFPVVNASFYISESNTIKSFGLRLKLKDADIFYRKMFDRYGNSSLCSPSKYFLEKKGYTLPREESKEAIEQLSKMPFPILEDYKDINSSTWTIESDSLPSKIDIKIYNYPMEGSSFESPERILRVIFREEIKV